jgi:hypothetical protein
MFLVELEEPAPIDKVISPPFPLVASPVRKVRVPLVPTLLDPVDRTISPLLPANPAFADDSNIFPVETDELAPLRNNTDPPLPDPSPDVDPATIEISPPL